MSTHLDTPSLEEKRDDEGTVVQSPAPFEIDPEIERRVVRKLDLTVLLAFGFVFLWTYADKQGLTYAAIFGLKTDLHLVGQDYSWCSSIFYFGQLIAELPVLYLLHKLPIRSFVAITMVLWSICMATQAATQNFAGLMVNRFFLGFTEGAVAPAFVILVSVWYRKTEQPIRVATFVSFNALAQIVGALLLYGCASIKGGAIAGWRISFLVGGALTLITAILFFLVVPASPSTAWFLKPEEREVAVQRVAQERASGAHKEFVWSQVWDTLRDPMYICVFLWAFFITITSVVVMGAIVIAGFGFTPFLSIIIAACALRVCPNSRGWIQMALALVPLAGAIMMYCAPLSQRWVLTGG
ncbi:hypothetical protein JCM8097_006696 [Rhodosporidiobolus ruineniae]